MSVKQSRQMLRQQAARGTCPWTSSRSTKSCISIAKKTKDCIYKQAVRQNEVKWFHDTVYDDVKLPLAIKRYGIITKGDPKKYPSNSNNIREN